MYLSYFQKLRCIVFKPVFVQNNGTIFGFIFVDILGKNKANSRYSTLKTNDVDACFYKMIYPKN